MKKLFSLLISLVMLMSILSVGVAVFAATPDTQVVEAYAGQSISIKFIEDNCYGVSGAIEYSNRNLFSSLTPGGTTSYGKITEKAFILSSADKVTCEVILSVKIADDAKIGDNCVVSFTDCDLVENNEDFSGRSGYTKTVTVKVVQRPTNPPTQPTTEPSTNPPTQPTTEPSTNPPTNPPTQPTGAVDPTTNGGNATAAPTAAPVNPNLDLTELNKQIGIANGLNKSDYTADSWQKMTSALAAAKRALSATAQSDVNKAADALKAAIAALVRIDSSTLEALIAEIESYLVDNNLDSLRAALDAALAEAKAALSSGDQDRIVAAQQKVQEAFEAYKAELERLGQSSIVEVEKPIEVEPSDPFCNIWLHKLWLILMIVSFIINAGFITLTVLYFVKRKQNSTDTTPLVDYDIIDD